MSVLERQKSAWECPRASGTEQLASTPVNFPVLSSRLAAGKVPVEKSPGEQANS